MKRAFRIAELALVVILAIMVGIPLYALPAILSLPRGPRPGVERLTISQAAQQLRATGKTGWLLVEAARALVAERMQYSRRNTFDTPARAFERGYGYCHQQAFALVDLLTQLGFEAQAVHAFQNRFPDGNVTSHAWVNVTMDNETRYVDSLYYDAQAGEITFVPLSKVRAYTPFFKLLTTWGGTAVNAHRYYVTRTDE